MFYLLSLLQTPLIKISYNLVLDQLQISHSISNMFLLLLLFLHNRHGTKEIPNCGNLVRPIEWET